MELVPFRLACQTAGAKECLPQEIRDAYDNSSDCTGRVLSDTNNRLAAEAGLATSLLCVSDHGGSPGEGGLCSMAPEGQTDVATVLSRSGCFDAQDGIDRACHDKKSDAALRHDNLFHTVLGSMNVESEVRNPTLDPHADCRTAEVSARR